MISERHLKIPSAILSMLEAADTNAPVFPPTILYNEGWLLRLVLSSHADGINCLPFSFLPDSKWFSEAQLYSPFLPQKRGDPLGETWTHVDGVVGHFRLSSITKTGLELVADAKQFVVIEAKMFSPLSKGTKNAPSYDQAARTVACMAATLERAGRSADDLESTGFYVVAPTKQIDQEVFTEQMSRPGIAEKVQSRIEAYREDSKHFAELRIWFQDVFGPLLNRIDLRCVSWETAIDAIAAARPTQGGVFRDFYIRCLKYNPKRLKN